MPVSLNGVTLHVKDVEKSREFYAKIPGATLIVHRPGDFALFRIGAGRLGLLRLDYKAFHMEFDTSVDLDHMHAQLIAAGLQPESEPKERAWGQTDFYVLDPDGNMVEFGAVEGSNGE